MQGSEGEAKRQVNPTLNCRRKSREAEDRHEVGVRRTQSQSNYGRGERGVGQSKEGREPGPSCGEALDGGATGAARPLKRSERARR